LTRLAGVLGFPVSHSRSPAMMNAAFEELGIDWRYIRLPVPPERFEDTVRALEGSGYSGANVTIPHKLAAHALADEHGAEAAAIGAANTLTFRDGRIVADNTDAGGLLDALGAPLSGCSALVLGAGGAGRAAVWALREAGAEVALWNRTGSRARELAEELEVEHAEGGRAVDVLVNATSVGLDAAGDPGLLPLDECEAETVVDLVYGAAPTPVCRWGAAQGARVVDGLEVLVRQGARSLHAWTGLEPPVEAMRKAAAAAPV
jgi:shikimate dehydrogenase